MTPPQNGSRSGAVTAYLIVLFSLQIFLLTVALEGLLGREPRLAYPPAGATTLIVSLGILCTPTQLVVLMAAVVLLTIQAWASNHLAGLNYPTWKPSPPSA